MSEQVPRDRSSSTRLSGDLSVVSDDFAGASAPNVTSYESTEAEIVSEIRRTAVLRARSETLAAHRELEALRHTVELERVRHEIEVEATKRILLARADAAALSHELSAANLRAQRDLILASWRGGDESK